jgi:hypothetical protein
LILCRSKCIEEYNYAVLPLSTPFDLAFLGSFF